MTSNNEIKMFTFNGHGETIPPYKDLNYDYIVNRQNKFEDKHKIELLPGEFIILVKEPISLRGASWIQDILFNDVLTSINAKQFVENIHNKINKSSELKSKNDLFGYFGYRYDYEKNNDNKFCPNIQLDSALTPDEFGLSDRFGLFNVPINVDKEKMAKLMATKKMSFMKNTLRKINFLKKYPYSDIDQQELIINYDWNLFNDKTCDLLTLINYIRQNLQTKNKSFVLFLNVCRSLNIQYRTLYTDISKKTALNLSELIEIIKKPNALAKEWTPQLNQQLSLQLSPQLNTPTKTTSSHIIKTNSKTDKTNLISLTDDEFYYKQKYLKYKQKYLKLKAMI